jgi:uncharacterized membrane protein YphA (DoxX/SURF4 family)
MLTLFPLQWLALFAYFILRVVIGLSLIVVGLRHWRVWSELIAVVRVPLFPFPRTAVALLIMTELLAGLSLTLGLYIQVGALLLIILSLKMLVCRGRFPHPSVPMRLSYLLYLAGGLSLFITGAGALAFDLPI